MKGHTYLLQNLWRRSGDEQDPGHDHQHEEHGTQDEEPGRVDLSGEVLALALAFPLALDPLLPFLFMMLVVLFVVVHVLLPSGKSG
jgi:hypothetical protein